MPSVSSRMRGKTTAHKPAQDGARGLLDQLSAAANPTGRLPFGRLLPPGFRRWCGAQVSASRESAARTPKHSARMGHRRWLPVRALGWSLPMPSGPGTTISDTPRHPRLWLSRLALVLARNLAARDPRATRHGPPEPRSVRQPCRLPFPEPSRQAVGGRRPARAGQRGLLQVLLRCGEVTLDLLVPVVKRLCRGRRTTRGVRTQGPKSMQQAANGVR